MAHCTRTLGSRTLVGWLGCCYHSLKGTQFNVCHQEAFEKCCTRKHHSPAEKKAWKVLFFGTDEFSLPHLKLLHSEMKRQNSAIKQLDIVVPSGQSVVRQYATTEELSIHNWPLQTTEEYDVGALASFGHIIPKRVIAMFPLGILNVHPSLLPKHRGAAPLQHTILSGEKVTGVSIMEIKANGVDIGPLLQQVKCQVPEDVTTDQLRDLLSKLGAALLLETIQKLPKISKTPQEEGRYAYAHKLKHCHSYINWNKQSMDEIYRQYRALYGTFDLRSELNGKSVALRDMVNPKVISDPIITNAIVTQVARSDPGSPVYLRKQGILAIRCKDGWAGFRTMNVKKSMSAKGFHGGYLQNRPSTLFTSIENNLSFDVYQET